VDAYDALQTAAVEAGWSLESMIHVATDFIDTDGGTKDFKRYLRDRVTAETAYGDVYFPNDR
jgi:hypothetical protein